MTTADVAPRPATPPRELRGAPDVPLWRNPTAALLVVTVGLVATGTVGHLQGWLPIAGTIVLNSVGMYLGFTVLHEAVHRTGHRNKAVNDAMGWIPGLLLYFTLPMFRTCHSKHHANTNDPENDPDHAVSRQPAWLRVWWLFTTIFNYRRLWYGRRWWRSRRELAVQVVADVLLVFGFVWVGVAGPTSAYAVIHVIPVVIAGMFLFYTFDFLPHYPFDSTERYRDTRIQPGRLRHAILLGQNYHLVHHLWVTIPWYRYRDVFHLLEDDLVAQGARID